MDRNTETTSRDAEKQREYANKIREILEARHSPAFAYVDTYGCQQNESDSDKLRGMLIEMGCGITSDENIADIVVINTCAIRENAENRVLGNVGALVHTKRAKKTQIIVFCGCLAAVPQTVEKIKSSYKHVKLTFPPNQLWRFPELLYKTMNAGKRVFIDDADHALISEDTPVHRESAVKAWLSIMYGCNNFCSYCIVPHVRGRERSRRAAKILEEAQSLVAEGYKDITLLGQNVNSYTDEDVDFPNLLRKICEIEGDFLVRFMTSHPKDASDDLFKAMSESEKAARHIHLPFQSGSDRILKLMNRNYTAAEYLEKIAAARKLMPDIVITSDVIVGFPGETQKDFEDTLALVKAADFEAMFTFIYSKRPGTPAANLTDDTDRAVVQERFERLVDLQNEISERKHQDYVGKKMRVLIDGSEQGEKYPLKARTNGGRLVHLGGTADMVGNFVEAKITQSNNWSLFGETVKLGAAMDIGTTTVALTLIDMHTGARLASIGRENAQAAYGADVTSRIRYCMENGHEKLTEAIRSQIASMITDACDAAALRFSDIENIAIAGNTIMQHLVAGYSPISMGTSPFTPVSLFGTELPAWESFPAAQNAKIYYTPAISAYVGGDITAGLLAAGFEDIKDTALFIDIGTNGEIALKHKGTYYCCAAAAGPAFEGAGIAMGMAAMPGAIDHVWQNSGVEFSVIGNIAPKGLCGSGLLDLLALLLDTGAVDGTGRLVGADKAGKYHLAGAASNIYVTGEDIRNLQLAKAAIAGGIQVLLHYAGIAEKDIKLLALAGGFGSFINAESAARIGLFPKMLLPTAKAYGNTSGEGAVLALCDENVRKNLENIRRRCEYIELSSNALFNEKFLEQMGFDM